MDAVEHADAVNSDRRRVLTRLAVAAVLPLAFKRSHAQSGEFAKLASWPLNTPHATGIHDLAPAPDGGVWFTAQRSGHLGWFDPRTGKTELVELGTVSAPHGVIAGPDGAAWITDGGQTVPVACGHTLRQPQYLRL